MSENTSHRPQPRFTVDEKAVHVSNLMRLGSGDRPGHAVIRQYGDQIGVRDRTLYRWLADANLRQEHPTPPERRGRFECDTAMVTVVAQEQSLRDAYDKLRAAGIVEVGYSTFCRAFDRVDPAVKHGALSGRKAMAENRVYLKKFSPHRCYAYHVDHTEADVFVLPSHRHTEPIRPKLTIITDAYSGYMWAFVWYRKPDGQAVAAALASVCVEDEVDGVSVGGIPQQVILDNAAEHFDQDVRRACTAMGVVMAPTSAYSSWQNGIAERSVNLVNSRVSKTAPGSIRAGRERTSTRFLKSERAKTNPANL